MAITLSKNTFVIIPEGRHTFKVVEVNYNKDFGKMEIKLVTADGLKQTERFTLLDQNGEYIEKAIDAFSFFARTVMQNANMEEIEEQELVGKFINAEVVHTKQPNRNDPTKTVTFVNLKNYEMASGFENNNADIDSF